MPKIDRSGRATNAALATAVLTPDAPELAAEKVTAPGPVPGELPVQRQAPEGDKREPDEKGGERPSAGSSSRQSSPKRGSSSARK
jgi:hypothetical protein